MLNAASEFLYLNWCYGIYIYIFLHLCTVYVEHISLKKQALLLEEVQKLNRENSEKSEKSDPLLTTEHLDVEAGAPPEDQPDQADQPEVPVGSLAESHCEDCQVAEILEIVEVIDQGEADDKQAKVKLEENNEDAVKESEDASTLVEEKTEEVVTVEEEAPEPGPAPEEEKDLTPIWYLRLQFNTRRMIKCLSMEKFECSHVMVPIWQQYFLL